MSPAPGAVSTGSIPQTIIIYSTICLSCSTEDAGMIESDRQSRCTDVVSRDRPPGGGEAWTTTYKRGAAPPAYASGNWKDYSSYAYKNTS